MVFGKVNGSSRASSADPTSIGNLAIRRGYATEAQVVHALQKQEARAPLGKILMDDGVITESQLEELLVEQEIERKRLGPRKAAKLWAGLRRNKMREVTRGLQDVALSLTARAKT